MDRPEGGLSADRPDPGPAGEDEGSVSSASFQLVVWGGDSFRGTIGPLLGGPRRTFSGWVDFMATIDELRRQDHKDHPSP